MSKKFIDGALLDEKLAQMARDKGSINYDCTFTREELEKLIDEQPKADGIRVVHCRDCVLFEKDTQICKWWNIHIHNEENYCLPGTEKTLHKIPTE
jgi:hypothetical protein